MKHAFLVIAHDNFPLLKQIIERIDHPDSNIYIHIDKKSKFDDATYKRLQSSCILGQIHFLPRRNVSWGGFSLIQCEIQLLKRALLDENDYYHLLSGHDYLLTSIDSFISYFDDNSGLEFIGFSKKGLVEKRKPRYCYYHFLQDFVGKKKEGFLYHVNNLIIKAQRVFDVDRTRKHSPIRYKTGSQWFSITKCFAEYIVQNESLINRLFRLTRCCDEIFVQTLFMNSGGIFHNYMDITDPDIPEGNIRAIDWRRGKPYVWGVNDFEELMNSGKLICRKVDTDTEEHRLLLDKIDAALTKK